MSLLSDASLVMIPSGYKDGTLYSAKPTNGDGDFTFSRGSNLAATRVNSEGLIQKGRENLLLQSNSFDTTWTNTNTNETGGQTGYDGSSDAWLLSKTSSSAYIAQSVSNSNVQTFSVYAKEGDSDWIGLVFIGGSNPRVYFDLSNGTSGALSGGAIVKDIQSVGNGWYRCSVTCNGNINSVRLYPAEGDGVVSGTSGSILIQDAQLEVGLISTDVITTTTTTAQAGILEDMPRLDYSGGATCGSLILEPQRSNLLTQSEYFGAYSVNNGTATANQIISPEGILNAYQFTENTGTSAHYIDTTSISVTSGNSYVISLFAKYDGRFLTIQGSSSIISSNYATFNLQTGVVEQENIGDASIEDYGSGWYRCIFKITATGTGSGAITILLNDSATGGRSRSYTGDGQSGIYIYGFQVEAGSYPTSYIPTYGSSSSVTRSVDDCVSSDIDELIGDNQGTLFVEGFGEYGNGFDNHLVALSSVSGGSGTDRLLIYTNNTNGNLHIYIDNGSVAQYGSPINLGVQGTSSGDKIAVAYADNDLSVYVNGTQVATSSSGTAPTCFYLQFNEWVGNHQHKSVIKQAILFPTRLTNDELAALTTI